MIVSSVDVALMSAPVTFRWYIIFVMPSPASLPKKDVVTAQIMPGNVFLRKTGEKMRKKKNTKTHEKKRGDHIYCCTAMNSDPSFV